MMTINSIKNIINSLHFQSAKYYVITSRNGDMRIVFDVCMETYLLDRPYDIVFKNSNRIGSFVTDHYYMTYSTIRDIKYSNDNEGGLYYTMQV